MTQPLRISAIIPTLNEQETILNAIEAAEKAGIDEIIFVDGGSTDETAAIAARCSCQFLKSAPGRAIQMNEGARASSGNVLLFLHADNWLEPGAAGQIREALADADVVGGAFQQRIEADGFLYRWIEWGNALRVTRWRLAYGDQGMFVRRSVFERVGGFSEVPLLEDVLLSRQLRPEGKTSLLPGPLHVSARRWQEHGAIRQTIRNWMILAAHRCGVSPKRLARYYKLHR